MTMTRRMVVVLLLAASAAGLAWLFLGHQAEDRLVDNANVIGGIAGATALAATALTLWSKNGGGAGPPPRNNDILQNAAGYLARETLRYWREQSKARKITTPSPVTVRWRWAGSDLAPAVEDIRSLRSGQDAPELLTTGVVTQLRELYLALPEAGSRIVVLGSPGAGKTTAMMLLLIDVLGNRQPESAEPVPVWLTLGGWHPGIPLHEWAATILARDYPALATDAYCGPTTPAELIHAGKVALFLDGLDEMPDSLRGPALEAIDRSTTGLRVVLTSRPEEFRAATRLHRLWDAAVIDVLPVEVEHACDYLLHQQTGAARPAWQRVAEHLRRHPESVAARTLTSPLALSLARDAYTSTTADPADLLDARAYPSAEALLHHLLRRLLVIAYPDPAHHAHAVRWLTWIACHLDGQRDIRWWHIPTWMAGSPQRLHRIAGLAFGLASGLVLGLVVGLGFGLTFGLFYGLASAIMLGPVAGMKASEQPESFTIHRPHRDQVATMVKEALAFGLGMGILGWLVFVLVFDRADAVGLAAVCWLVGVLYSVVFDLLKIWTTPVITAKTVSPLGTYRSERRRMVVFGLVYMLVFVPGVWLLFALFGHRFGPLYALLGLIMGAFGLLSSRSLVLNLVLVELFCSVRRTPVRFIRLLEDALDKQLLRQAGAIYQFRHAALQDLLTDPASRPPLTEP